MGLPIALYKAFRDPIWGAATAAYLYFAIPDREFIAPPLPYQAAFWGIAVLSASIVYRRVFLKSAREEIDRAGLEAAHQATETVRGDLKNSLLLAALRVHLPGELRQAALGASEAKAIETLEKTAPKPIGIPIQRAVKSVLSAAADAGEREAIDVAESLRGKATQGNLLLALEARVNPVIDQVLDTRLEPTVLDHLREAVEASRRDLENQHLATTRAAGAMGIPIPRGPLTGVLSNPGLWLHLAFMVLTYVGAQRAEFDVEKAMTRFDQEQLLLIPMIAIICAVRDPRHMRIFTAAWMLGTAHLCMNAIVFWKRNGGRADDVGGQGGESNFLGAITVMIAPIAFGMVLNPRVKRERWIGLALSGIYCLGVIASGSRAALIALLGSGAYWLFHTNRKGIAAGVAAVAAAGFLTVASDKFWERMGTILGEKDRNPWVQLPVEPSKHEREVLWELALELYLDHPLMGIGPRQFTFVSAERTDFTDAYEMVRGLQAHNLWLQLGAEFGTFGVLIWGGAFALAMGCYARARIRMKKYPGWEWFASTCLGFEAGLVGSAIACTFNSFQWYDYHYWHFVFGPIVYQIAKETAERLDWLKPIDLSDVRPPPRYGPPMTTGLDLDAIRLPGPPAGPPRAPAMV